MVWNLAVALGLFLSWLMLGNVHAAEPVQIDEPMGWLCKSDESDRPQYLASVIWSGEAGGYRIRVDAENPQTLRLEGLVRIENGDETVLPAGDLKYCGEDGSARVEFHIKSSNYPSVQKVPGVLYVYNPVHDPWSPLPASGVIDMSCQLRR